MGKYEPLQRYLETQTDESWEARFAEIEAVLGFRLPNSAYVHRPWWSNQTGGGHSHAESWQGAGWQTRDVDLAGRTVRFERAARRAGSAWETELDPLFVKATQILGTDDRVAIMRTALDALIHRAAAAELIGCGGTMPDLVVPPRERPAW